MKLKLSIITVIFLIASVISCNAHDWYPLACCSGHDCHPIPCDEIIEKGKSMFYHGYEFMNTMIKASQDSQCHVCIGNEDKNLDFSPVPHCLFIVPSS